MLLQRFDIAVLIMRHPLLPTAVEYPDPLEGQGTESGVL